MDKPMTLRPTRRALIKGAIAGTLAASAPGRLFAQANPLGPRDRRLFDIAKTQLDKAGDVIWRKDVVGIADFGVHSANKRFHFLNMGTQEVKSFFVTHGTGSDPEHDGWLNTYSNVHESLQTSRGAYVTWEWYRGRFGTSVRLGGLDPTNDNAFPRAIVLHKADYATQEHVDRWGRLGRSNGCFAMGPQDFNEALWNLSGGRLLYADSLGIGADGQNVTRPAAAAPLTPGAPLPTTPGEMAVPGAS
jgi:hypothetical protein